MIMMMKVTEATAIICILLSSETGGACRVEVGDLPMDL